MIGTIQCSDHGGPVITWNRSSGSHFVVAFEFFGMLAQLSPWEFKVVAFDNEARNFTVYIDPSLPNGLQSSSYRADQMAVDLTRMLKGTRHE